MITALAASLIARSAFPGSHVLVGLALAACLIAIAWFGGVTAAELGVAGSTWRVGLRWGAACAALVAAAYALAFLVAPLPQALPDSGGYAGRTALVALLVVIPLATVLPEEVAFRGLLLNELRTRKGALRATVLSSCLFGLWHVLPSLGGGLANEALAGMLGADAAGTVMRVLATVVFTSIAGVVLCELRVRSGSLIAPVLTHWAANGLGVIVALVAS